MLKIKLESKLLKFEFLDILYFLTNKLVELSTQLETN